MYVIKQFKVTHCHSSWETELVPPKGEIIYEEDTGYFFFGDGVTSYHKLPRIATSLFFDGHAFWNPDALETYINNMLDERLVCVDDLL